MENQILTEIREMRNDLGAVQRGQVRLETLLTPTAGQPSRLDDFNERLHSLESARNWVLGAWGAVCAIFGIHVYSHKG